VIEGTCGSMCAHVRCSWGRVYVCHGYVEKDVLMICFIKAAIFQVSRYRHVSIGEASRIDESIEMYSRNTFQYRLLFHLGNRTGHEDEVYRTEVSTVGTEIVFYSLFNDRGMMTG
jgi:hypothetical protein